MDQGVDLDRVFPNFAEVFDSVNHRVSPMKILSNGINLDPLVGLNDLLSDRSFVEMAKKSCSFLRQGLPLCSTKFIYHDPYMPVFDE